MISALVYLVIYIVVVGLIIWLLTYLIDAISLPEPFHRVARIGILVIGVLIVILLLLNFAGLLEAPPRLRP
jgi:cytochrome c biogenesis protein CcdA